MPKGLTASTGMDALTHAIEGYITKGAWEMTDMFHLKAIELISKNLRGACENTKEGREGMALGQYIAGMGFSNVGLGIVHSMAHALGAVYDTPHGVANAILLPTVMEYNAPCTGTKYKDIAIAMGVEGVENMSQEEYRKAAVDAVKKLSADVGIPADLKAIVKAEDVDFLAQSAMDDACRPGNPKDPTFEDIKNLYLSLMGRAEEKKQAVVPFSGRSFVFLLPLTNGPPAPAGSGARQRVTVSGPYAPHRPVRGGLFLLQNC